MSVRMIQERLAGYACQSALEEEQALREITQEVVLAGLSRGDFFRRAGFQGGTCLRIFHGLNRFSEDLDFALDQPDLGFSLTPYLEHVREELQAYGYAIEIDDRSRAESAVKKAFLKDDSLGKLLHLSFRLGGGPRRKVRVKLEVDARPPAGAAYEVPVLEFPYPAGVRIFDLPSLFAGKMHALLCREYVKGRDWYDFLWYVSRGGRINHALLTSALAQHGPWQGSGVKSDDRWCATELRRKIARIDWHAAREDVRPFMKVREWSTLVFWTQEFFTRQCAKLAAD